MNANRMRRTPPAVRNWPRAGLVGMIDAFVPIATSVNKIDCQLCGKPTCDRVPLMPHEEREFRKLMRCKPHPDSMRAICRRHRLEPWRAVGGMSALYVGALWRYLIRGFAGEPVATPEQQRAMRAHLERDRGL